jgi:Rho GTPase-activating protein 21/23
LTLIPFVHRLIELKSLLKKLPPHSYETLKHLMCHLNRVSSNCVINLMEPRNLAIVFGPSVVRTANETLETAVKDMKHQCQIVEALVSNVRMANFGC